MAVKARHAEQARWDDTTEVVANLVARLKKNGSNLIESIKLVRTRCGLSLGEAKRAVTSHPLWRKEVERNEPLHETLLALARKKPAFRKSNRAR